MANLYENIKLYCTENGTNPSRLCTELGLSKSMMSDLKAGRKKSLATETLRKIADHLGVTVSDLLGEETKKEPVSMGDELIEILEACKERSDLRILFKLSKDATREDVLKAIAIIKALKND